MVGRLTFLLAEPLKSLEKKGAMHRKQGNRRKEKSKDVQKKLEGQGLRVPKIAIANCWHFLSQANFFSKDLSGRFPYARISVWNRSGIQISYKREPGLTKNFSLCNLTM